MAFYHVPGNFGLMDETDPTKMVAFDASLLTTGTARKFSFPDGDGTLVTQSTLFNLVYPVGAIYMSVVSTSPATLFGGTWAAFGTGRTLVGIDAGDVDFDTVEEVGGAKSVAAAGTNSNESAHTHSVTAAGTNSAPTFTGNAVAAASTNATPDLVTSNTAGSGVSPVTTATGTVSAPTFTGSSVTSGAGSAHTHAFTGSATSVVQPYVVVYMWKRTA